MSRTRRSSSSACGASTSARASPSRCSPTRCATLAVPSGSARAQTVTPCPCPPAQLSIKITDLSASIERSDSLWHNAPLRASVLRGALPAALVELAGGADVVIGRLPENYCRALFGSSLASRFVYAKGLETPEFAFFEYVDALLRL